MSAGTLELVALELAAVLEPLERRLGAGEVIELLAELGVEFPPALEALPSLVGSLQAVASSAVEIGTSVPPLVTAIDEENYTALASIVKDILEKVRVLIPALEDTAEELKSLSNSLPGLTPADVVAFAEQLPPRLLDYLLVSYLEGYHPILLRVFALVGIIELINDPGDPADPGKPPHTKRIVHFDRIADLLQSPENVMRDRYGWGTAGFDAPLLLERVHDLLSAFSLPNSFQPDATPPALRVSLFRISPRPDLIPPGIEAVLEVALRNNLSLQFPFINHQWALEIDVRSELEASLGIALRPPADLVLVPPAGSVQGELAVRWARLPIRPGGVVTLLGLPGGSGLQAQRVAAGVVLGFKWDSASGSAKGDFGIEGKISGGKFIATLEGADGFLGTLLSGAGLEADFDVGFGWTSGSGIYFTGSAALEIQLPMHIELGPIEISALSLLIGMKDGGFPIELTGNIKAALGPLQVAVEDVGVSATLSFPADQKGNAGPLQFDFGFRPPSGAGLVVDAAVVKGGGYLYFDYEGGEYAGALELTISEIIAVKAIGIITTKMPDGSNGFSLLLIITAEFGTGIQLGFGFTLIGVGGLLGLNRTVRLQPLADGVRTGAVNNIMFPKDVVANAPRIISDLRAIFPPFEGKFLIGPMAKLGWGSPPLITLSLGVIIEIPGNLAILGVLRCILPDEKAPVLVLQVAFVGAIEFDKKRLWLFAGIFDSKVLTFTLEGEMGVLFAWGDAADFVLSVGGFHPRFKPPPLPFPSPKRLAISILDEDSARIRVSCYFAVTTNTVQFGARAELYFGFSAISVEGNFHFDALFQFSPFYFIIELGASVSLKIFGMGLFSVSLELALEGPTPWHAHGTGSISFFFFSVSANFDETWGEEKDTTLPPIEVFPILAAELAKEPNWSALPPKSGNLLVSLRVVGETKEFVLHPVGTLRVTQRSVPLNSKIDLFGSQKPADANRFTLAVKTAGLGVAKAAKEEFAPAQFHAMSRTEKLAAPAFAQEEGGVDITATGNQLRSSLVARRVVRYEQIIIDTNFKRFQKKLVDFSAALFSHFLLGNAAARSVLSARLKNQMQPFKDVITTDTEGFGVAATADNKLIAGTTVFGSYHAAKEHMEQTIAQNPGLAGTMHVVPGFEVNQAA